MEIEWENVSDLIFLSQEVEDGVGFLHQSPMKVSVLGAGKSFLEHRVQNGYASWWKSHSLLEEKTAPSEIRNVLPRWLQFWLFPLFAIAGIALYFNISLFFSVRWEYL